MARSAPSIPDPPRRVPHACGDGPTLWTAIITVIVSSPRLWGWPGTFNKRQGMSIEFPTPVGMARHPVARHCELAGVPHACGDGPSVRPVAPVSARSSPRLWGWPELTGRASQGAHEFPTPVGMARDHAESPAPQPRVPHACGDGPTRPVRPLPTGWSSPRLWGWPARRVRHRLRPLEFPTPVGMARIGNLVSTQRT